MISGTEEDSYPNLPNISIYMGFQAYQSDMARKAVWNMLLLHGGPLRSWHTKQFYLMANLDPRQVWIQTIPIHGFGPKTHTKVNTFANDAVKAVMNHEDMEAHRAAAAQTIARAKLLSQRPYLFLHRPVKP